MLPILSIKPQEKDRFLDVWHRPGHDKIYGLFFLKLMAVHIIVSTIEKSEKKVYWDLHRFTGW